MSGFGGQSKDIQVIAQSAVAVAHTGTTAKTAVVTIPLPPLGANDQIRYQVAFSSVGSVNNKTYAVTLGGVSGTDYLATTQTLNHIVEAGQKRISNRGVTNLQYGGMSAFNITGGGSASAPVTSTIDTSVSQNLCICITLANASETAYVESYIVELIKR